jgi:hypothetical protein
VGPVIKVFDFNYLPRKDKTVWEGTRAFINCSLHTFNKAFRFSWTGPLILELATLGDHSHSQYHISNVTQSHSGEYVCKAVDVEKEACHFSSVNLTVQALPSIHGQNVSALEGKKAVLRCTTSHAKDYLIKWKFQGKMLENNTNIQITRHKLTIHPVSRHHTGVYECKIDLNEIKKNIAAYPQLTVNFAPELIESPINVTAFIGDSVEFHCNVTGSPLPGVSWQRHEITLDVLNVSTKQSSLFLGSVLTLQNVQQEDRGHYKCIARNNYGEKVSQRAILIIQGPPCPPQVEVISVYKEGSGIFMNLSWAWPKKDPHCAHTDYQLEASCKSHDRWFKTSLDSEVSGKVQCASMPNISHTAPLEVLLLVRLTTVNSFGRATSKSLHIRVLVEDWNRQSSFNFHVFLQPSPSPPLISAHSNERLASHSTSNRPYTVLPSENTPSESLTYYSDLNTAEISPHNPDTELQVVQTGRGTDSNPQVIEAPSNKTNFKVENSPGKDGIDLWVPIGVPTGILVYIIIAIILRRYVVYRKQLSIDIKETTEEFEADKQEDEESDPIEAQSGIPESMSPDVSSEFCLPEDVPGQHSFTIQIESCHHSFVGSCLQVEIDADGGEYQSGSLWLSFPPNAVLDKQSITAQLLFDTEWTPPTDTPQKLFVFSPILSLEPQNFHLGVPVCVRFPFTAVLEGWTLVLMRVGSENKWSSVLAIDTDECRVSYEDGDYCYDVETELLHLSHFCNYQWCGYKKEGAFRSEKKVVCSLFAQMDPAGNLCKFNLHLSDCWQDVTNEIVENESIQRIQQFVQKDYQLIRIGPIGNLRILIDSEDFELDENEVVIPLEHLWPVNFGHLIQLSFMAKVLDSEKSDQEVRVKLSTESQSAHLEAVFGPMSEQTVQAAYQISQDRWGSPLSCTFSETSELTFSWQGSDKSGLPVFGHERPLNDQVSVATTHIYPERNPSKPPEYLIGVEDCEVTVYVDGGRLVTMPTVPSEVANNPSPLSIVPMGDSATVHKHLEDEDVSDQLSPADSI